LETRVVVIVGPTCSGKTDLSIDLAIKLNSEIISADSRQVYKLLDIGTAKPSLQQTQLVKHHLVDLLNPDQEFNVSKFSSESSMRIDIIHKVDKIPIISGGSGLYIKSLIDGIIDEVEVDQAYRDELYELRKMHGNEYLYDQLQKVDLESAAKMLPQNWKRVVRALEVYHSTGKTIGYFHSLKKQKPPYNFIQFGLEWERATLYKNINDRVDTMIERGLIEEVKYILQEGFNKEINSLNTVGYKEIISYLENEISLDKAIELIKRNTRRFAKRQITWFKADKRIRWYKVSCTTDLEQIGKEIFKLIK
jgi:tRNA dimethylallyltransferase